MGTCEDRCPSIDLVNEISMDADLKGANHTDVGDCDEFSEQVVIQKLEDCHIREEGVEVGIQEGDGVEEEDEEGNEVKQGEEDSERDAEHNNDEEQLSENRGLPLPYPLRSNADDCSFYMKTGSCKFGFNCRFNHPISRVNQVVDVDSKDYDGQGTDGIGKIECKYYSAPGGCKFGETCRYSHFKEETGNEQIELNFLGLPIRKGERECPYYMRNGSCGYGANCRFHHPDPTAAMEEPKNLVTQGGVLQGGKSFAARNIPDCPPLTPSMPQTIPNSSSSDTYMPWMNSIPQGMPQQAPYNQYQVPPVSLPDKTINSRPGYSVNSALSKADSFGFNQQQMQGEEFPERLGQPECDHFIRTGTCKFGSRCRFHHPRSRLYSMPNGVIHNVTKEASHLTYHSQISMEEYPERPGEPECSFFMRNGDCKYKSLCKYHHPKGRNIKSGASTYGMNGLSSRMAPILPHEARKLPDLYPSHSNQMAKPYVHHQQPTRGTEEFPDCPGQPECEYFMKTGDCKFKYTCRFHHPKSLRSQVSIPSDLTALPALNEKGLPLRPGAKTCRNYEQLGICKYGPRCLFDHPSSVDSAALPESSTLQSPGDVSGWDDDWVIG